MTHPLFRKDIFIETAFERRFQETLRSAWRNCSWHVIVADPGAGKTMGIRDLVKTAGSRAILGVVAPKNNEEETPHSNQQEQGSIPIPKEEAASCLAASSRFFC